MYPSRRVWGRTDERKQACCRAALSSSFAMVSAVAPPTSAMKLQANLP
jgi:hypothetical protein